MPRLRRGHWRLTPNVLHRGVNIKSLISILIVIVGIPHPRLSADEPSPAIMPYRVLCQMAQLEYSDMTGFTNHQVSFMIKSSLPDISISDIHIYIDSETGRLPLHLNTNGILTLPISEILAQENPNVVANQPKGTLTMEATLSFWGSRQDTFITTDDGLIPYSSLFLSDEIKQRVLDRLTEMQKRYDLASFIDNGTVVDLIGPANPEPSSVTIQARTGDINFTPVDSSHYIIRFDAGLMREDPWVRLTPPDGWSITLQTERMQNHGLESTSAPPAAGTLETHP